jgi:hypothetical protein
MVWMHALGAAPTAWRPVGGGRDGPVDTWRRRWTTRTRRELSPIHPRVVHGSGGVHPRPRNRQSTELSPDVGEVCAHGDVERPTGDREVVTPRAGSRWSSPRVHQVKRTVTGSVTVAITRSGRGAVSVVGRTTSGCVSREAGRSCRGRRGWAGACGQLRCRPGPASAHGRARVYPIVRLFLCSAPAAGGADGEDGAGPGMRRGVEDAAYAGEGGASRGARRRREKAARVTERGAGGGTRCEGDRCGGRAVSAGRAA